MQISGSWCAGDARLHHMVCSCHIPATIGSVKRANWWCVCGARKRVLASRVVLAALREAPCADNIHRPRTQHASLEEIGVRIVSLPVAVDLSKRYGIGPSSRASLHCVLQRCHVQEKVLRPSISGSVPSCGSPMHVLCTYSGRMDSSAQS